MLSTMLYSASPRKRPGMTQKISGKKEPQPSQTRTAKDKVMIVLGITLIFVFLTIAYFSLNPEKTDNGPKQEGPVKNPRGSMQYFQPKFSLTSFSYSVLSGKV
jgi:hypothetical protein